jgi:hypothetical protein
VPDERLKRTATRQFASREYEEREITEDRILQDEDRALVEALELEQEALPNLPEIPGFKTIWLSTTNQYDTIAARQRLGYTVVKPEEVPGFEHLMVPSKIGGYENVIGWNEMIAFKLPIDKWFRIMSFFHNTRPLEEEERLSAILELMVDEKRGKSLAREVGDGTASLGRMHRRPSFQ